MYYESMEAVLERMVAERGGVSGRSGGGGEEDPEIAALVYECYACELLGVTPGELDLLDYGRVEVHVGWAEGRAIGEWATQHREA